MLNFVKILLRGTMFDKNLMDRVRMNETKYKNFSQAAVPWVQHWGHGGSGMKQYLRLLVDASQMQQSLALCKMSGRQQ
jgi:hypothetical protein